MSSGIECLEHKFTVCKVEDLSEVNFGGKFCFLGKTDEEISLVCLAEDVPSRVMEREDGWRAFRIKGVLDFSLIGILSRISTILADQGIAIFVVSTFNTDYILVKEENYTQALTALEHAGYAVSLRQEE